MTNLPKAKPKIVYEGKDISIDLMPYLISFSYRDKAVGEADELNIQLRNNSKIWMWTWNPKKGDTITAEISVGDAVLPCGTFTVDEPTFNGGRDGGHVCTINALSAGVKDHHRTKTSFAHEGKTLKQIAEHYASKYGYKVQGITHNYSIARVTQWNETDLGFLHRLASEYGYLFTLKGNVLVFTYYPDLNTSAGAVVLRMSECISYSVKDKVIGIYVRGQNRYYNHKKKQVIESNIDGGDTGSADTMRMHRKVDNDEHGLQKVDGRLYKQNLDQVQIDVTVPGNVHLMAGNNATTADFYNYNDTYMVAEAQHNVSKDGDYTTSVLLKKLVPNKGNAGAGTKKTGIDTLPDISKEAKVIYDTIDLLIAGVKGKTLTGATASGYNAQVNNALMNIRSKGAIDVADDVQSKYGGAIAMAITGNAAAVDEGRSIQNILKPYMK